MKKVLFFAAIFIAIAIPGYSISHNFFVSFDMSDHRSFGREFRLLAGYDCSFTPNFSSGVCLSIQPWSRGIDAYSIYMSFTNILNIGLGFKVVLLNRNFPETGFAENSITPFILWNYAGWSAEFGIASRYTISNPDNLKNIFYFSDAIYAWLLQYRLAYNFQVIPGTYSIMLEANNFDPWLTGNTTQIGYFVRNFYTPAKHLTFDATIGFRNSGAWGLSSMGSQMLFRLGGGYCFE